MSQNVVLASKHSPQHIKISKVRPVKGHSHVVVGEGIVMINYHVANRKI